MSLNSVINKAIRNSCFHAQLITKIYVNGLSRKDLITSMAKLYCNKFFVKNKIYHINITAQFSEVTFKNGSTITIYAHCTPNFIRGHKYHQLIIDKKLFEENKEIQANQWQYKNKWYKIIFLEN